jgi:hypothetical protein
MIMPDFKILISLIAVALSLVAYVPYLKDTFTGKTTPHIYTWFIWGFVTAIAYALQVSGGAGAGSWVTLGAVIIAFVIFACGLRNGKKDITKSDTLFFILALIALLFWLLAKQPIISVILVTVIDLFGFAPTIRKSWNKPYSETLFTYQLNAFRHGLSVLALQKYSILTWLYPISWALTNLIFSIILIVRRRQVKK